jgi:nucleoside-diphosphate-sugar epimerase
MTVYGSAEGLLDELSPTGENLNAYAAAHVAAEALARDYPATVVLRLGCEVGPGCVPWSLRIARLLSAHRLGDLGAQGDGICNLLYIEDLLAALKAALTRPGLEGGTFNLAMRSPPSWNEYLVRFAIALGAVPVSRIGQRRLAIESRFIAPPLKALELLSAQFLGGRARIPPPIPPSLLRDCRREVRLDVSAAEAALDLTSTPLDIALAAAAAWCATQRG